MDIEEQRNTERQRIRSAIIAGIRELHDTTAQLRMLSSLLPKAHKKTEQEQRLLELRISNKIKDLRNITTNLVLLNSDLNSLLSYPKAYFELQNAVMRQYDMMPPKFKE